MSMTESEAIAKCQSCNNRCPQAEMACEIAKGRMYATDELIKCQKELEQYRAIIGLTPDDLKALEKDEIQTIGDALKAFAEWSQYKAIGTVSEFQQLKEKATAKRPFGEYFGWTCPNCGEYHHEKKSHCTECNQNILWT